MGDAGGGRDTAKRVSVACFAWMWTWMMWGNSSGGRQAYLRLSALLMPGDTKGILPLITLAAPILVAAAVSQMSGRSIASHGALRTVVPMKVRGGDPSFDAYAVWMIVLPLCAYVTASLGSLGTELSVDERISKVANAFGQASLIALCLSLVPVARHSAILKVFRWNPAAVIRLHAWSGWVVVVAGVTHGLAHLLRFRRRGYPLIATILPPSECLVMWRANDTISDCRSEGEECSCYNRWRNLLGASSAVLLIVLGLSSLNVVRRRFYSAFYRIHVLAGPMVLLCVVLHWSRSILYLAGGLVYYMSSSFALLLEQRMKDQKGASVEVIEVQHLANSSIRNERQVVAITLAATDLARSQFLAGYYVQLRAPDISPISHPFTINRVPHHAHLRILFRVEGKFTLRLSDALRRPTFDNSDARSERTPTRILLDGFHGAGRLLDVIHHDRLVVVAGGIGITPYLSLLQDLLLAPPPKNQTRTVVLHWCCRDESLIAYVEREYFCHLAVDTDAPPSTRMRVIIHNTKRMFSPLASYSSLAVSDNTVLSTHFSDSGVRGSPFCPSYLTTFGSDRSIMDRRVLGLSFVVSTVLSMVSAWFQYSYSNGLDSISSRLLPPALLLLISIGSAFCLVRASITIKLEPCSSQTDVRYGLLEAGRARCETDSWSDPGACDCGVASQRVPVHRSAGRPLIDDMLHDLQVTTSDNPGLMVCGPPLLVKEVRLNLRNDSRNAPVSVYEERFEL